MPNTLGSFRNTQGNTTTVLHSQSSHVGIAFKRGKSSDCQSPSLMPQGKNFLTAQWILSRFLKYPRDIQKRQMRVPICSALHSPAFSALRNYLPQAGRLYLGLDILEFCIRFHLSVRFHKREKAQNVCKGKAKTPVTNT